jgi:primosomal protein N' (replication factor Y)
MILLNRRGYAPLLYCLDCENPVRCPECELSLTFHKDRERLVCHYCGYTRPHPAPCPTCGGTNFLPMGVGAELLEEQLSGVLPAGTKVLRLDRDVARRPERAEAILADFAAGRGQVLVGTQMLSKGQSFPGSDPGGSGAMPTSGAICPITGPRSGRFSF